AEQRRAHRLETLHGFQYLRARLLIEQVKRGGLARPCPAAGKSQALSKHSKLAEQRLHIRLTRRYRTLPARQPLSPHPETVQSIIGVFHQAVEESAENEHHGDSHGLLFHVNRRRVLPFRQVPIDCPHVQEVEEPVGEDAEFIRTFLHRNG